MPEPMQMNTTPQIPSGTPGSASAAVDRLVEEFAGRRPLRAGAFIVTLYGDAVVPRGGSLWVGNVI